MQTTPALPRLAHRADVEGLRALAILLVVAVHAGLPGFGGGFVGVDVFFVISGFLVTGILVREQLQDGRIDLARFYARRLRRLLPALLLMLWVAGLAGWLALPATVHRDQAIAGATASFWASNLHLAFASLDYFGAAAESNIYLHTWSLGVEEQFYLVWPFVLGVCMWCRRGGPQSGSALIFGMVLVLLVGFLVSLWVGSNSMRMAFYLMPTRAWQFAAGALVCLVSIFHGEFFERQDRRWVFAASGWLGLALLMGAVAWVDKNTPYPGRWAALPTLGTALLVFAGSGPGEPSLVSRVLCLQPLQALGRVSYAWYLWHWPVWVIGVTLLPMLHAGSRLLLVGVGLLLAVISFLAVEQPLRRNERIVRKPSTFIVWAVIAMALTALMSVQWGDSVPASRDGDGKSLKIEVPSIYAMGCDDWYRSASLKPCVFGSDDAPKTVVVLGDSIGLQWFPAYQKVFGGAEWQLVVLTKSSCPMVDRPFYYQRIGREFKECALWRTQALELIAQNRPDLVIVGSTHTADFSREDWIEGTRSVLAKIAPHVGQVVVMQSTPTLPFDGAVCAASRSRLQELFGLEPECVAPMRDPVRDRVADWLSQAAQGWPNAQTLDMHDAVCPAGICRAVIDGQLVFRDHQHLNAGFAAGLSGVMAGKLGLLDGRTTR